MILRGDIEIYGMVLSATVEITGCSRPRAYKLPGGKWRAYKTINGIQRAFGSHDTKEQALNAARYERLPVKKKNNEALGIYKRDNGMHRVLLTIGAGNRVRLGEYATRGHAVLVRDVVARRTGLSVHVLDYEMPLGLVTNAVARSYIRDLVPASTAADLVEYERRVAELNGVERAPVVAPVSHAIGLPPELWRVKQPSRAGRSPFDTLDDAGG